MLFAAKSADVRIWRSTSSSLSEKCPHWTYPLLPDCGRLLWTAPNNKINQSWKLKFRLLRNLNLLVATQQAWVSGQTRAEAPPWIFIHDTDRGRHNGAIFRSCFFRCPPPPWKFFCRRPCQQAVILIYCSWKWR